MGTSWKSRKIQRLNLWDFIVQVISFSLILLTHLYTNTSDDSVRIMSFLIQQTCRQCYEVTLLQKQFVIKYTEKHPIGQPVLRYTSVQEFVYHNGSFTLSDQDSDFYSVCDRKKLIRIKTFAELISDSHPNCWVQEWDWNWGQNLNLNLQM